MRIFLVSKHNYAVDFDSIQLFHLPRAIKRKQTNFPILLLRACLASDDCLHTIQKKRQNRYPRAVKCYSVFRGLCSLSHFLSVFSSLGGRAPCALSAVIRVHCMQCTFSVYSAIRINCWLNHCFIPHKLPMATTVTGLTASTICNTVTQVYVPHIYWKQFYILRYFSQTFRFDVVP